jgi:hypothetical protein
MVLGEKSNRIKTRGVILPGVFIQIIMVENT